VPTGLRLHFTDLVHAAKVGKCSERQELKMKAKNQIRTGSLMIDIRSWAIATVCLMFLGVSTVLAQTDSSESQDQWEFAGAIYLWGADINGQTGRGSSVEVTTSDLLDNLEMAFMGAFAARKNNWSLLADVVYLDLGVDKTVDLSISVGPTTIPVTTSASLDQQGLVLQFVGGYSLYSEGSSRLDLIGGARYLDLDTDLFLELDSLGPGQSRAIKDSLSVWDAVVGLQGNASLGEQWFLPYHVDVGFGQSKLTWQAVAGIGFRAGRAVDLALVYRHLEWDFDSTRLIDDINFSGPTLGVIFRW
jgi:hypothetical protein